MADDLCEKRFPQLLPILPGLVMEGVTLLAARPKIGKTWLLQQIACAVGGEHQDTLGTTATWGDVLYLNLEDGNRRAQRRLTKYFGIDRNNWPRRMRLADAWRPLRDGGIEDLREWCREVVKPTLITVDTLKKVRPVRGRQQSDYAADYEACEPLKALCEEFPGLGIIVAHHDRKAGADDVFDTVSGTLGLTGGVDAIMMLKRVPQGLTLHITGRDLENDVAKLIEFDREACRWRIGEDLSAANHPDPGARIVAALEAADGPMTNAELAAQVRVGRAYLDVILGRLAAKGTITRVGQGKYAV